MIFHEDEMREMDAFDIEDAYRKAYKAALARGDTVDVTAWKRERDAQILYLIKRRAAAAKRK